VRNAGVVATALIREVLIDGRLRPCQRLKEEELARQLGISRTPVRQALLILQPEGLGRNRTAPRCTGSGPHRR
jgi:DNA-binding GntR family transcriptional regulator